MNIASREEIRRNVIHLLEYCVDEKLRSGGTGIAISSAQQAYELATANNIPSPWPEIAAYRLAHLQMRSGNAELGQLREIDRLFEEASRSDRLGPIPLVYRLAVLHRLRQILKDRCEIDQTTAISDEVYERAVRLFQRMQFEIEVDRSERIERQTALFNMLEFVTYLSGRPYQPIEGMSSLLPMDPFREGDWFVLGQDIKRVRMTESMARWEFDCRAEECPETVLIELTGNSAARICLSKDRNWRVWSSEYAKLILLLLQNPEIPRVELERRVVGTDGGDPSSRFRQAKSRVKKELAKLTGKESLEVFAGDRLTNEVPILGLVLGPSLR